MLMNLGDLNGSDWYLFINTSIYNFLGNTSFAAMHSSSLAMDPNTTTRERWTQGLVDQSIPSTWPQSLKDRAIILRSLADKLGHHQAMTPNNQQTFMTPANSKNKVYFMWDFVGRTIVSILISYCIDKPHIDAHTKGYLPNLFDVTSLNSMNAMQKYLWEDVQQRCVLAADLILDTTPGKLNATMEQTYPASAGNHPEFGDDIIEEAKRLRDV